MDINYCPHMWMPEGEHADRLAPYLEKLPHSDSVRGYHAELLRAYRTTNHEAALLSAHHLACDPQCPPDTRAALRLENARILADEGDLGAARILASQASRDCTQQLGRHHPLSVELRRYELHWMTFTLMEDIAQRRYKGLIKDALHTWGDQDERYWSLRLESIIPLAINRSTHPLIRRLHVIVREMPSHTAGLLKLRIHAALLLGQHHLELVDLRSAQHVYERILEWIGSGQPNLPSDGPQEASPDDRTPPAEIAEGLAALIREDATFVAQTEETAHILLALLHALHGDLDHSQASFDRALAAADEGRIEPWLKDFIARIRHTRSAA